MASWREAFVKKRIIVRVRRFDPRTGRVWWQRYEINAYPFENLASILFRIRDEIDPTLGVNIGCRMGVCGSCAMLVNGVPRLACQYIPLKENAQEVVVEPLPLLPVVKDLIVDFKLVIDEVGKGVLRDALSDCINCGLCHAVCPLTKTSLELTPRLIVSSQDTRVLWYCTLCGLCSLVCPVSKNITDLILTKRRKFVTSGLAPKGFARHALVVHHGVTKEGLMPKLRGFLASNPLRKLLELPRLALKSYTWSYFKSILKSNSLKRLLKRG